MKHKTIKTYGKAIITGEHSVLRGGLAVAFPLSHQYLEITTFLNTSLNIPLQKSSGRNSKQQVIDQKLLRRVLELCGKSLTDFQGNILIKNNLAGGGLGSSAALCVALGRLMVDCGFLHSGDLFNYCHTLEKFFHGESSGLDVAVILEQTPVFYQREQGTTPLKLQWQPHFFVSFCGQTSQTDQNITKVQAQSTLHIDQKMSHASSLVIQALQTNSTDGLPLLIEAIQTANLCFEEWSLITKTLKEHLKHCQKDGAIAVKPTGSGGGGHVLSLFKYPPTSSIYTKI